MTPTDADRLILREYLDEEIPAGGTDADTRFTTAQLDALLVAADSAEAAAAEGWTRKAIRAYSERAGVQETSAGSERIKFVTIESYRDHCLAMAAFWQTRIPGLVGAGGSQLLGVADPDVLGGVTVDVDLSRLVAYEIQ